MLSLCSNLLLLITLVQQESGKKKKNTFILTLLLDISISASFEGLWFAISAYAGFVILIEL